MWVRLVPDLQPRGRGSNPAHGCCVPMPTRRAIPPGSAKAGSKQAYHAMNQPHICGLAASAGVG